VGVAGDVVAATGSHVSHRDNQRLLRLHLIRGSQDHIAGCGRPSGGINTQHDRFDLWIICSCLQGLSRYGDDLQNGLLEADYIVVEMARQILGENWLPDYVREANQGGIERVLV
jgi:hypothetical protein